MASIFSALSAGLLSGTLGCSRDTSVYPDAPANVAVIPVSTDGRAFLPKDFYNQSVNQASVELQPDGTSATAKAIRFQTTSFTNTSGGFNGAGLGNRAILGLGTWHGRPLGQAEPLTFDAKNFAGIETIGVTLQLDLQCDGAQIRVLHAAGPDIGAQTTTPQTDGYTRFTASTVAAIWLSPTGPVLDPDASTVLVPATGTPVSLAALLAKYPAACLKNAASGAPDLAKGIPTAAILWNLGTDATTTTNKTFVRRFTVGSEVFEGLE